MRQSNNECKMIYVFRILVSSNSADTWNRLDAESSPGLILPSLVTGDELKSMITLRSPFVILTKTGNQGQITAYSNQIE